MGITDSETITSFSEAIKAASWGLHQDAEGSRYMDDLLAGKLDLRGYTDLVIQHYYIYQVLEDAASAMGVDPVAAPFVRDELTRLPALEADLLALLGAGWRDEITPTAATQAYRDRMADVCFGWAGGFVAHHYVRYMGDLSGGQQIKRKVQGLYGITPETGTAFYAFDQIADLGAFKDNYRRLLDEAAWSAEERARIIDEVLLAYQLNTQLLNEL
jgi:heme oxygenase